MIGRGNSHAGNAGTSGLGTRVVLCGEGFSLLAEEGRLP